MRLKYCRDAIEKLKKMYNYPDWKTGDLLYNRKLKKTAHFYGQFVQDQVIVLPMDGEKMGDEEWWLIHDVEWISHFIERPITIHGGSDFDH